MKMSKQKTTVLARVFAMTLLCTMLLLAVSCKETPDEDGAQGSFDYQNCNFEEYFTLKESDYRNQTVIAPYPQYVTDKDVEDAIKDILLENGTPAYVTDRAAIKGDTVNIYYKGVMTDGNGKETAFDGGTYMDFGKAYPLTLGSGQFIDGFEDALIGVIPENSLRFVSDDATLTVVADSVIHVTYEATYEEKGETKVKTGTKVLENLENKTFGEEFATALLGAAAGETRVFDTKYDINSDKTKETVSMKATVVDIAVMTPTTVSATFPESYPNSPDLAGKTVKFYVWVESITETVPATLDKAFVTDTMKLTVKDGEDAIEVFEKYVRDELQSSRDDNVYSVTVSQAWANLLAKAVFKKLPESEVKACYDYEMETLEYYYEYYAYYASYYGQSFDYKSVEEFAPFYYGVSEKDFDLEKQLTEVAENSIKRELIFNYLCKTHNLGVDDKTLDEELQKFFQGEADYANSQNASATYTAESVREELEKEYGEGYFEKYIFNQVNSERVEDFLFSNYTVTYTEESEAK